ncbi:MAG TPA: IgGFc-binding protein [Myxococcales bacterium]|jgi:hypothetical protein
MASRLRALAAVLPAAFVLGSCSEPPLVQVDEPDTGGIECLLGQKARAGVCICINDTGCLAEQYCDAITGVCRPKTDKPPPDASTAVCTSGARRCAPTPTGLPDGGKFSGVVQECKDGQWTDVETCPAEGYCAASASGYYCAVCANGATRCKDTNVVEVCSEKGDQWEATECPNDPITNKPSKCENGECQACVPGTVRCSTDTQPDGTVLHKSLETCAPDGSGWNSVYCAVTGTCLIGAVAGSDAGDFQAQCVQPVCSPGADRRCKDATTLEICTPDGLGWEERNCTSYDKYATAKGICRTTGTTGDCYEPCATAARESSYLGCEYWAAVTSNIQLDPIFKGGAVDGTQPDAPSEFAVVVSNPNAEAVDIRVTRKKGGVEDVSPSDPAAVGGLINVPANTVKTIKLPWQSIPGTGVATFGYHLTSTLPISAYQFNPVVAYTGGSPQNDPLYGCTNCSYTNDGSLLIPAHIFGASYVVLGQEHITIAGDSAMPYSCTTNDDCPGIGNSCTSSFLGKQCKLPPVYDVPALFTVVAPEDNTKVTIKFSAATVASKNGTTIAKQDKNSTASYVLNKYDLLQFWSGVDDPSKPAECFNFPAGSGWSKVCRYNSDPTGTIVLASDATDNSKDKPVAVFSGADCSFKPYNKFACDHLEEMMLPFSTWGKNYAGVKSVPYKDGNGSPVKAPFPDYWRVVSGCGKKDCPNGTKVTIKPPPGQLILPDYPTKITCQGSICTLPPIDPASPVPTAAWLEFTHASNFTITADQPVMLSQFFTGEEASAGSVEGDPSIILTPPIEQWRTNYNVLTSPTLLHNYLSLVTQSASPGIKIDGKDISTFGPAQEFITGGFAVFKVPVAGGAHSITSKAKVGVTVYGYDYFVSYGYTGGLDLLRITQIVPGG